MPNPALARRARTHLAAALIALPLLVPFASARADTAAVAGARTSASPNWECVLGTAYFFTKIPYEFDTDLFGYLWQRCW